MPVSNHAEYMRQWRQRRAAAKPREVAQIAPQEEAPEEDRRVPSAAPRKVAPVVGGYQARAEDGWVARMSSKEQQAILARMAGEPRGRGEGR